MNLEFNKEFRNRKEIGNLLGGNIQMGITKSTKINAILLFTNEKEEAYNDYFEPEGTYENCVFTGIGRQGDQDDPQNNIRMYNLNRAVIEHKANDKPLLLFEKKDSSYYFVGEYRLIETDTEEDENSRIVYIFRIKKVADSFNF